MNTTPTHNGRTTRTHVSLRRNAWKMVTTAVALACLTIAIAAVGGSGNGTGTGTGTTKPRTNQTLIPTYPQALSEAFGLNAPAAVPIGRAIPTVQNWSAPGSTELSLAFGPIAPAAIISAPAS